jgi:hypothetical protein
MELKVSRGGEEEVRHVVKGVDLVGIIDAYLSGEITDADGDGIEMLKLLTGIKEADTVRCVDPSVLMVLIAEQKRAEPIFGENGIYAVVAAVILSRNRREGVRYGILSFKAATEVVKNFGISPLEAALNDGKSGSELYEAAQRYATQPT